MLPIELMDMMWLNCDKETLEKTRDLQSNYIKEITQYFDVNDSAKNGNIKNLKWLYNKGNKLNYLTFENAVFNGNLIILDWLLNNKCPYVYNRIIYHISKKDNVDEVLNWVNANCDKNSVSMYKI